MLWSWTQCDYRPPSGHTGFKITSASTAGSPATKNSTAQPANPAYKGNRSKDNINRIPALVNPLEHPISILSVQPGAKEKGDYDRRSLRSAAPFFRSEDRLFHWITTTPFYPHRIQHHFNPHWIPPLHFILLLSILNCPLVMSGR